MRHDGRRSQRGLAMGLIQPELLVPAQWLGGADGLPTAEKRLLAAMVIDAIQCFKTGSDRVRTEAAVWLTSKRRDWPFSFENICDVLAIDADGVRAELARWRASSPALPEEEIELAALAMAEAEPAPLRGTAA